MDDDEDLTPSERARDRRRDRDMTLQERVPMDSGGAKWWKQVDDLIASRARKARARLGSRRHGEREEPGD